MKNNMLNNLKSSYEELEIKPSSDLWSRLDEKLDDKPEKVLQHTFQWWKYAAVVLFFISVGAIFYFNSAKNTFDHKETDYIVKKSLEKTINPINPELQNTENFKEAQVINIAKKDSKLTRYQRKKADSSLNENKIEKILKPITPEIEIQNQVAIRPENTDITPAKIENHTPVLVQEKSAKPTYINSNELLLGREFDKARGTSQKNDIKFGIFNFEKPRPKVENVTVLGVTVYVDPK